MNLRELTTESLRIARSQPVASTATALLVAAACVATILTTGRAVAGEREVLARIDDAGTRLITIVDSRGDAGLHPDALRRIRALSGVEWVLGLGPAADVRSIPVEAGTPVTLYPVHGELPPPLATTTWPRAPGTALAGTEALQRLGLDTPAGGVRTRQPGPDVAIVGWHLPAAPLDDLADALLAAADPSDTAVRSLRILAATPQQAGAVAQAAAAVLGAQDPTSLSVETAGQLVAVRDAVQSEFGRFSRQLLAIVLGSSLVLVGVTVYSGVTSTRRDFGRRRALGASRPEVVVLVLLQTTTVAVVGAITGALIGSATFRVWTGALPPLDFVANLAYLAILTAATAALIPALVAAWRDPVRVLRVP